MVPTLQRALPIVGAALGRKLGVQIEVSGRNAFTDGERIVLPAFDPERPDQALKTWGFLSHEAAHIRYTDFELDQGGSAFRRRLTNLLEDMRIERALSREYPGTAFTLSEVVRQLVAEGRLSAPAKSDPAVKVLHDSLLAMLRYKVLGQKALKTEATKAKQTMATCFPAKLLQGLDAVLTDIPKLDSTRAAQDMADKIIGLFQNSEHTGNSHKTISLPSKSPDHQESDLESAPLLWKTKAESARLAAQLTGLVQAKTLCRDRTGKKEKKLDGKRLHRMAIGDNRLFCKRSEAITIDATVHLCLDISSSMASRMELARKAVLALAYALNQINGVTVSVSAYPGKNDCGVFEVMKPHDRLRVFREYSGS